jgi:hypothetical protein
MGKTYKDRNKWERKQRDKDVEGRAGKRPNTKRHEMETLIPEDEPLDLYEMYDYEDYE